MFPRELIVTILRIVYEHSCRLLNLSAYRGKKKRESHDLTKYINKFWSSRSRNKIEAQLLVTPDELLAEAHKYCPEVATEVISSTILALKNIEALWELDVDTNGSNVKRLLLTPVGLGLWKSIDEGSLLNQQLVTEQNLHQMMTTDLLLKILKAEREAWFDLIQEKIAVTNAAISPQSACLGIFLLLNGAIAREHPLHLIRTTKKDFKWHDTVVKGLNVIAEIIFGETLFTNPSLRDDLERRSELIQKIGPTLKWLEPPKGSPDEYWLWEIGDYYRSSSTLDHIVRNLIYSFPSEELETTRKHLKESIDYFINKIGYQLSSFQMSELFPNPPTHDFGDALQISFNKVLDEIALEL